MRPEDFSPGNMSDSGSDIGSHVASMRPEDFSPGNAVPIRAVALALFGASMRPEDFSPGNPQGVAACGAGVMLQ